MSKAIQWQGDNAVYIVDLLGHHNFTHKKGVLTVDNEGDTITVNTGEFLVKAVSNTQLRAHET
jgi:hypothetical protein